MSDAALPRESGANKELIGMLQRSRLFRDYETVFTKATGLALTLRPLEYWQLAHRGKKNENPFCALLAEDPKTLAVCLEAHDNMIRHTGDVPHTVTCPFGLTETAVPVKLGQKTIGYLRIGQVLRKSPQRGDTERVKRTVITHGGRFTTALRKAWELNPLIPADKYSAIIRLLSFFAAQLSDLINQIMLEKQNVEHPVVQKAREYIEKNKGDAISLASVAQAAGASVFHFSKIFHKSTGLTFTDYVSRVRLNDARTQLLNPSRRVSEIAYEVGFQSLTQFNRTFKRVFGQSPTKFRASHVGAAKPSRKAA
jgi:AraC-like DNA-binding protein/ligand-binding sensor protein